MKPNVKHHLLFLALTTCFYPRVVAGVYSGDTDDPTFDQLLATVNTKAVELSAKINEAESVGVNVEYALITQTTISLFKDLFVPWDRANPDAIEQAYQKRPDLSSTDPLYQAYGSSGLVFDELADCIEIADSAIAELDAQTAGTISRQASPKLTVGTTDLSGTHYEINGNPIIPYRLFWQPMGADDEAIAQAYGRMGGAYYAVQQALSSETQIRSGYLNNFKNILADQTATQRMPQETFLGHVVSDSNHWTRTTYPDAFSAHNGNPGNYRLFTDYDIDNPIVQDWLNDVFGQFLPAGIGQQGSGDASRIHMLANEPRFPIRQGLHDSRNNLTSYTYAKFAIWLEDKYSALVNLNSVYGTAYSSFSQAATANYVFNDGVSESLQGGPIWYDWCRFNMDRVNDWFAYLHTALTSANPGELTHLKVWGEKGLHARYHDIGIDFEYVADLVDLPGADCQLTPLTAQYDSRTHQDWRNRYVLEWRSQSMMMDFNKSIVPEKPYLDMEWHGISGYHWRDFHMQPGYLRAALWLSATHGLSALKVWVWNRDTDGSIRNTGEDFVGTFCSQPWIMDTFGRTMKEINAHGASFISQVPTERYYMIYYCADSAIQDNTYSEDLADVYESLKLLNVPVGFTTPSRLSTVEKTRQTVIVPRTPYISDSDLAGLQAFVSQGGSVILVDSTQSFEKTELGAARTSGAGFSPMAMVNHGAVNTMATDFEAALNSRKPSLPLKINVRDANSNPAYGVLATQSQDSETNQVTCTLINMSQQSRMIDLYLSSYTCNFVDLITSRTLSSSIVLQPQEVRLIRSENLIPDDQSVWFNHDPISVANSTYGVAYSGSIAGFARDLNGDPLTFSKVIGPAWLTVSENGSLSGTPGDGDGGLNLFTVQVTDNSGGMDTATVQITVEPEGSVTAWEYLVMDEGLSGTPGADKDSDGETDLYEFAFGGDVADAVLTATMPGVRVHEGNSRFVYRMRNQADPGIQYEAFWTDDLINGTWINAWKTEIRISTSAPEYIQIELDPLTSPEKDLFFKVEVRPL